MPVYISYLSHSVYMERIFPGRFSSRPSKAESRFARIGTIIVGSIISWLFMREDLYAWQLDFLHDQIAQRFPLVLVD